MKRHRLKRQILSSGFFGIWCAFLTTTVLADSKKFPESEQFRTFGSYQGTGYDQAYRPKFHFTSLKNWINDPNGLMYYDGEYHLFFQHNPLGTGWGNMTWGHAVSTDMVHWEQMPHAITPYGSGYVFSGTGVVDHNNSLGKQVGDNKTLVLLYSYAVDTRPRFGVLTPPEKTEYYQGLAYSTDRGRSFSLLNDGAPVIPFQGRDVDPKGTQRDPKLFWHEPTQKWVAILWMGESSQGRVRFFTSDDLQNWTFASDMIRPWAHECFDLIHLPVVDDNGNKTGEKKWLIYDGNFDYEVGDFDGKQFTPEQPVQNHKLGHWNAAQTFNNSPDGRTVIMGWLVQAGFYKKKMPFAEQLTFPATMELRKTGNEYRLYRWPIAEIASLYGRKWELSGERSIAKTNEMLSEIKIDAMDISIEFAPQGKDVVFDLRGSKLTYVAAKNHLHFISKSNLDKQVIAATKTPEELKKLKHLKVSEFVLPDALKDGVVNVRILLDRASFEIFLNAGECVLTHSEISELDNTSVSIWGDGAQIKSMTIHELKSMWNK